MLAFDPRLLEQLEGSTCYGIAYDGSTRECKICDLQQECSAKSASNRLYENLKVLKPETQKAIDKVMEERKKKDDIVIDEEGLTPRQLRKKRRKEERERIGMPNTKLMSIDECWALLKERGGTCGVFEDERVQKTRLTVAIKKTYIDEYERKQKEQENN